MSNYLNIKMKYTFMVRPYYVKVPYEGDNIVELIQFGDSGGHNERKFGKVKAKQAMTYYAPNDIQIDGDVVCREMNVEGAVGDNNQDPEQVDVSGIRISDEKMRMLIEGHIVINGEILPEDYTIDVMSGKF